MFSAETRERSPKWKNHRNVLIIESNNWIWSNLTLSFSVKLFIYVKGVLSSHERQHQLLPACWFHMCRLVFRARTCWPPPMTLRVGSGLSTTTDWGWVFTALTASWPHAESYLPGPWPGRSEVEKYPLESLCFILVNKLFKSSASKTQESWQSFSRDVTIPKTHCPIIPL